MTLNEFIKNFSRNNLIRLLYLDENGNLTCIGKSFDHVCMDHEIIDNKTIFSEYKNNEVEKLASILVYGAYSEAINIVIKK